MNIVSHYNFILFLVWKLLCIKPDLGFECNRTGILCKHSMHSGCHWAARWCSGYPARFLLCWSKPLLGPSSGVYLTFVGFLQVLRLPPTIQRDSGLIGDFKLALDVLKAHRIKGCMNALYWHVNVNPNPGSLVAWPGAITIQYSLTSYSFLWVLTTSSFSFKCLWHCLHIGFLYDF